MHRKPLLLFFDLKFIKQLQCIVINKNPLLRLLLPPLKKKKKTPPFFFFWFRSTIAVYRVRKNRAFERTRSIARTFMFSLICKVVTIPLAQHLCGISLRYFLWYTRPLWYKNGIELLITKGCSSITPSILLLIRMDIALPFHVKISPKVTKTMSSFLQKPIIGLWISTL